MTPEFSAVWSHAAGDGLAVVPVLVGPLQALLAILPGLLAALGLAILALFKPSGLKRLARLLWQLKAPLVVIAAVITAAVLVWPAPAAGGDGTAAAAEVGADQPMWRGGPQRLGAAPGAEGPVRGGVQWRATPAGGFYSSPTLVGNRVYAVTAKTSVINPAGGSGEILCFDADNGARVWSVAPEGYRPTFSSPTVAEGHLVIGEGLHFTKDARLLCYDLSTPVPTLRWSYRTSSHVESTPAIGDGRVVVGAGSDGYYCFDLAPDADGQPVLRWHKAGARYPDAETSPAIVDGKVFVGLGMGGDAVVCFDLASGEELWRIDTPYPVFGPPTVADGRVIVGMGNGNFIFTAEQVREQELTKLRKAGASPAELAAAEQRLAPGGAVYSIAIDDPEDYWVCELPRTVLGAVPAHGDGLYAATRAGTLYRIDPADGSIVAQVDCGASIVASPSVTDEHVYVVTEAGRALGFDHQLTRVWTATVGSGGLFLSSPAVGRGHLYVGSEQHGLVCLGEPAGVTAPIWPGAGGGPGAGGSRGRVELPERGDLRWRYPPRQVPGLEITAAAAVLGDRLYVPLAGGPKPGLAALEPQATSSGSARWFVDAPGGVAASPACVDDLVLAVFGPETTDAVPTLRALAATDGSERWRHDLAPGAPGALHLTRDELYVVDAEGLLQALDRDGSERWQLALPGLRHAPDVAGELLVAAGAETLLCADRATGVELWRADLPAAATGPAVTDERQVLVPTVAGVLACDLITGAQGWQVDVAAAGPLAVGEQLVVVPTADGAVALARRGGAERGRLGDLAATPYVVLAGDTIYLASGERLARWDPEAGAPETWMDLSWLGGLTAPPIALGEALYAGSGELGFVSLGGRP